MKSRTIENAEDRTKAMKAIMAIEFPYVISVGSEKVRSIGQNDRYWSNLNYHIGEIAGAVDIISSHTGYTPLEVRRLIAAELEPEKAAILFARNKESVHDILKMICGVETSTRLGTKAFMKFETVIEATIAEILGDVQAFMGKVVG